MQYKVIIVPEIQVNVFCVMTLCSDVAMLPSSSGWR